MLHDEKMKKDVAHFMILIRPISNSGRSLHPPNQNHAPTTLGGKKAELSERIPFVEELCVCVGGGQAETERLTKTEAGQKGKRTNKNVKKEPESWEH